MLLIGVFVRRGGPGKTGLDGRDIFPGVSPKWFRRARIKAGPSAGCCLDRLSFDDFRSSLSSFGMTLIGPMLKGVVGLAANEDEISYYNIKRIER